MTGARAVLDELETGDTFHVDCHDRLLRVHSNVTFVGAIVLDAYDVDGAHWPIGEVSDVLYLGYRQFMRPDDQPDRVREIGSVEVVSGGGEA